MTKEMLLPHCFKKIGWIILLPTLLTGLYVVFNGMDTSGIAGLLSKIVEQGRATSIPETMPHIGNGIEPWLNNTLIIGIISGCIFIACSRERIEDEMIGRLRLNSLLLSLYVNFAIIFVATLTVYDLEFIDVLVYNLFTLPLLFLAVFQISLWQSKHAVTDEE